MNIRVSQSSDTLVVPKLPPSPGLVAMRGLWVVLFLACLWVLVQAVPARYQTLLRTDGIYAYQLTTLEAELLTVNYIPLEAYALFHLFFELIQIGAFVGISIWLFIQRSDDIAALLVCQTLMLNGVLAPAPTQTLIATLATMPIGLLLLEILRRILTVFFIYTFPDGQFVPRWTSWLALLWAFVILLATSVAGQPQTWSQMGQMGAIFLWMGPSLAAQVYRYTCVSTEDQRQQAKWFVFGISIILIAVLIRGSVGMLLPAFNEPGALRLIYRILIAVPLLDTVMFIVLPFAIGVSIAQHRLYGLNLVINRSLVYGVVILSLSVLFFLAFFALHGLIRAVGGSPSVALVLSSGLVAAVFNPARLRAQHFVDRRFFHLRADLHQLRIDQQAKQIIRAEPTLLTRPNGLQPHRLGYYSLDYLIGKGGMGAVYHATHTISGQVAAVKVLSDLLANDPQFRLRFAREAQALANLQHPNIVRIYDVNHLQNAGQETYYLAMEYIVGVDLSQHLKTCGRLPLDEVQRIIRDIASALDHAHAHQVVHRDVKPSNILLRAENGQAVLMDFGIAKFLDTQSDLTHSAVMGTLDYASPEQIMNMGSIDGRADVYALGVMTYQLLTGKAPFTGSIGELVFAHLQQPAPDPRVLLPDLPTSAALAVRRAMAKDPQDRYASAGAFTKAFCAQLGVVGSEV